MERHQAVLVALIVPVSKVRLRVIAPTAEPVIRNLAMYHSGLPATGTGD
jgi:hypothetical protein